VETGEGGGTFTPRSGTVTFDTSGTTSTVSGSTTFYNLSSTTASKAIQFTAGTTQTVTNIFTMTGASGQLISLTSTSADTAWNLQLSGTISVDYVSVQDSDASSGSAVTHDVSSSRSEDLGNNLNWGFGGGYSGEVLGTVQVLSPNGGEMLTIGATIVIDWTWTSGTNGARTQIYYSFDGGTSYTLIKDYYNGGTSEYSWTVPAVETTNGLVKITRSESTYTVSDTSNKVFTIKTSSVSTEENTTTETEGVQDADLTEESSSVVLDGTQSGRSPFNGEIEPIDAVFVGDYIRGVSYPVVYQISSTGTRRPFQNHTIFFTWQDDFSAVRTVSDATLSALTLGAPMLPKPGVVLVKIQSDPRVYAVEADEEDENRQLLRWISSEDMAQTLYGGSWAEYVIDLPPTLMGRFSSGETFLPSDQVDKTILKRRLDLVLL